LERYRPTSFLKQPPLHPSQSATTASKQGPSVAFAWSDNSLMMANIDLEMQAVLPVPQRPQSGDSCSSESPKEKEDAKDSSPHSTFLKFFKRQLNSLESWKQDLFSFQVSAVASPDILPRPAGTYTSDWLDKIPTRPMPVYNVIHHVRIIIVLRIIWDICFALLIFPLIFSIVAVLGTVFYVLKYSVILGSNVFRHPVVGNQRWDWLTKSSIVGFSNTHPIWVWPSQKNIAR
jgi:hypothetical protein